MTLRIGTRGSALALWQADWVTQQLRDAFPELSFEQVIVQTEGDRSQATETPLALSAGRGVFVKELEQALRENRVDLVVHSAKDMPTALADGTTIAAFCERGDPRDALIAPRYGTLDALPQGARVATSSPRRQVQLRALRPDLEFVAIRGNVDTRLAKLERGEADALVLAYAGLARLGRTAVITEVLDPERMLPQVGQGCVAVQCRSSDTSICEWVHSACDHFETRREVLCERRFLAKLGGGCTAPVAAYAISSDRFLYLFALLGSDDGTQLFRTRAGAALDQIEAIAASAYADLLLQTGKS